MKKSRIRYIDVVRGIAIISIILGHLGINGINRFVFTFHVPVFFFITGYFFKAHDDLILFIKKNARTLLLPYAVTCVMIIVCAILIEVIKGNAGKNFGCCW